MLLDFQTPAQSDLYLFVEGINEAYLIDFLA